MKPRVFVYVKRGLACAVLLAVLLGATAVKTQDVVKTQERSDLAISKAGDLYASSISHPSFVSPHAQPIAVFRDSVFVVNTPSDTLDVIHTKSRRITARINVGVDPVSVAIRPDGKEIWVSNHVSDSVSIIDNDALSPTYLQIVATVQAFDRERKATSFDEPMGIAFAGNEKAYVALSSDNQIAVIDVASRSIINRLQITAQDPRAIAVRNGRLYVVPFESNNKTQLSGGMKDAIDGDLVTFDAVSHSIVTNSKLSLGHVIDIVKHPDMPDRDLYIFDTETDTLIETVDTLGTLLYGLTVDSKGNVFIAQTDARNDANGRAGTQKHGLAEMENRAFLNRITKVKAKRTDVTPATFFDLEPLPPNQPARGDALATPYGIGVSDDDSTLVVSLAGSDKLITIDAVTGQVLGRVDVEAVPRGIALVSDDVGRPSQAWVLNAAENTVSLVDVADREAPKLITSIVLNDPTLPLLKQGRKAFETAKASATGTFACASCHPDGHTDQLLWVLNTPIVTGGDQIQPRTTMPIRGLRDTEPYHWDGIPGDPYGGHNAANTDSYVAPNSDINDPTTSTRHLIDASLANTMHFVGGTNTNDEGKLGMLSAAEREAMSVFLLNVPYPPAQRRPYDNVPSKRAQDGFRLFHIDGNGVGRRDVCGDCHRFPHMVSTNHPTIGMDTPTWRGAYDRFLILPQGRINMVTLPPFAALAEQGIPERELWRFSWGLREEFDPVWDMVLEHSTGYSGSFARQVTLSKHALADDSAIGLLAALEQSAREEAVQLVGNGIFLASSKTRPVSLFFDGSEYVTDTGRYSRDELIDMAEEGLFIGTVTAHKGVNAGADQAQPALWTLGPIEQQNGPQRFPQLDAEQRSMTLSGRHISDDAYVIVDGRRVAGSVNARGDEVIDITFDEIPDEGMHLLQVQTPGGLMSNDFIFHVVADAEPADAPTLGELVQRRDWGRLIGDWVDVGTRGEFRLSLNWKIKNQLLELVTMDQNGPSVAFIRVDQGSGRILHTGTNHSGVSSTGYWDFAVEDGPKMTGSFLTSTGATDQLNMQLVPTSLDSLVFRVGVGQLSEIPMIRKQVARNTVGQL
jgi:YVTN family beta-propeller protein